MRNATNVDNNSKSLFLSPYESRGENIKKDRFIVKEEEIKSHQGRKKQNPHSTPNPHKETTPISRLLTTNNQDRSSDNLNQKLQNDLMTHVSQDSSSFDPDLTKQDSSPVDYKTWTAVTQKEAIGEKIQDRFNNYASGDEEKLASGEEDLEQTKAGDEGSSDIEYSGNSGNGMTNESEGRVIKGQHQSSGNPSAVSSKENQTSEKNISYDASIGEQLRIQNKDQVENDERATKKELTESSRDYSVIGDSKHTPPEVSVGIINNQTERANSSADQSDQTSIADRQSEQENTLADQSEKVKTMSDQQRIIEKVSNAKVVKTGISRDLPLVQPSNNRPKHPVKTTNFKPGAKMKSTTSVALTDQPAQENGSADQSDQSNISEDQSHTLFDYSDQSKTSVDKSDKANTLVDQSDPLDISADQSEQSNTSANRLYEANTSVNPTGRAYILEKQNEQTENPERKSTNLQESKDSTRAHNNNQESKAIKNNAATLKYQIKEMGEDVTDYNKPIIQVQQQSNSGGSFGQQGDIPGDEYTPPNLTTSEKVINPEINNLTNTNLQNLPVSSTADRTSTNSRTIYSTGTNIKAET